MSRTTKLPGEVLNIAPAMARRVDAKDGIHKHPAGAADPEVRST